METVEIFEHAKDTAEILKDLGNKYRLRILCTLADESLSVNDLAPKIGLCQYATMQHLTRLKKSHLVKAKKDHKWVFYSVDESIIELLSAITATAENLKIEPPTNKPIKNK